MGLTECLLLTVANVTFCIAFPRLMYLLQASKANRTA